MNVSVAVAHSAEEVEPHLATADYLVAVLTKGLLQDAAFASVLVTFESRRVDQPVDIVTVLADNNFAFPSPEFYATLEDEGEKGRQLAAALRRVINILALTFSPAGSIGIMSTQVSEICRRFRLCKQEQVTTYKVSAKVEPDMAVAKVAAYTQEDDIRQAAKPNDDRPEEPSELFREDSM